MLSSTKSRRILHFISVTLALFVFGYGLILKYDNLKEYSDVNATSKIEQIKVESDSTFQAHKLFNFSNPD